MRTGFADIVCCSSSFKNDAVYELRSIQTISVNSNFTERYHIFCVIDRELQSGYFIIWAL